MSIFYHHKTFEQSFCNSHITSVIRKLPRMKTNMPNIWGIQPRTQSKAYSAKHMQLKVPVSEGILFLCENAPVAIFPSSREKSWHTSLKVYPLPLPSLSELSLSPQTMWDLDPWKTKTPCWMANDSTVFFFHRRQHCFSGFWPTTKIEQRSVPTNLLHGCIWLCPLMHLTELTPL